MDNSPIAIQDTIFEIMDKAESTLSITNLLIMTGDLHSPINLTRELEKMIDANLIQYSRGGLQLV